MGQESPKTPWFDLTASLQALEATKRYDGLCSAIRRLRSLYAVHADLQFARAAVDELNEIGARTRDGGPSTPALNTIIDSLFANAVVSYCRAVHSEAASGRMPILGLRHLSADERSQHQLIVDLRNKAVAHHGYGEFHPDTPWFKDAITVRVSPNSLSIRGTYVRLNTSIEALKALDALTRRSLARVEELDVPTRQALHDAFTAVSSTDPEFRKIVGDAKFDGAAFFGSNPGWDPSSSDFAVEVGDRWHWTSR